MSEKNQGEMMERVRGKCRAMIAELSDQFEGEAIPLDIVLSGIHCEAIAAIVEAYGGKTAFQVSIRAATCVQPIPSRESYELAFSLPPALGTVAHDGAPDLQ